MSNCVTESLILLVLDHRVPYLGDAEQSPSLLTLPVGSGSLLERLAAELKTAGHDFGPIRVAPCYPAGPEYAESLRRHGRADLRVMSLDEVAELLVEHESCDDLLLVDPRYWPAGGYPIADVDRPLGDYRGVTHLVAIGAHPEEICERVERDRDGRVKGVQRLYNVVNWPQVATSRLCLSLLATRVVDPAPRFSCLRELRSVLAARGVLSQDVALSRDVYDLNDADALLALSERALTEWRPQNGFTAREPHVWIGPDCRVDADVRLIPPVAIHRGCVVEAGATLIGPTVVGAESRIGAAALVAQSVVAPGSCVPPGGSVRERVYWGDGAAQPANAPTRESPVETGVPLNGNGHASALRLASGNGKSDGLHGPRRGYEIASRLLNTVLAGTGLILLLPLWVLIAVLIKLDSRGPIFFAHVREGRGGRPFKCLKFRTMVSDAHRRQRELYTQNEVDGPQFLIKQDPRVTRVGRWLRSTNLDELPQLLNVLAGHMSLVGPRPSPFRENQICVPWRRARLSVRPGITGLWQLCRMGRSGGDFHQWIYFDLTYVRHHSLWLDVKILIATVLTLGGRWSVPLHWLIDPKEKLEMETGDDVVETRRPQRIAGSILLAGLLLHAAIAGCHDPRISLREFVEMQQKVNNHTPVATEPAEPAAPLPVDRALVPYRVGPSDVLAISVTGSEPGAGFPLVQARVDREGMIDLPLAGRVKVADMEVEDVEDAIREAYVPAVLKDAVVHVDVIAASGTQVLVVGAVTSPGLVSLRRTERTLLHALVAAGGATQESSGKARLQRVRSPGEEVTLQLTDPVELEAALALRPLEDGDIITVIPAQPNLFFVGGLVNVPQPQPYPPGVEVTLLQALAASGGLRTDVTPREATLIRRMPDGKDVHVKIDLDRVTTARDPNITLAAGDILWVPETVGTKVQDWVNRNIYIRAGMSVHYDVSGIEFLNRRSLQAGQIRGGNLEDSFDPFGFLNRGTGIQTLVNRPPVVAP